MIWVSHVTMGDIYFTYPYSINGMMTVPLSPNPATLALDFYSMDPQMTLIFSAENFKITSKPFAPRHRCGGPK